MNLSDPSLQTDILYLLLKFFHEKGWKESAHMLERESRLYFDIKYFEEMVLAGKWDDTEYYLSGFTKVDDNMHSRKVFFDLRKMKYYEALDSNDGAKALDILKKDLKVFSFSQDEQELFNELTKLLTLNNLRENKTLKIPEDAISARKIIWEEIKKFIMENPVFKGKLVFPTIEDHSLNRIHQSDISDEESSNKSKPRRLPEFFYPSQCKICTLPRHPLADKIVRLSYNNAGNKILALASNGHHLVWEWPNPSSQDVFPEPQIYLPRNRLQSMKNDLTRTTNNVSSFDISNSDEFLLSTSGGNIYIFNMSSFKTMLDMSLPIPTLSAATCVAYYPLDNNVIVVGMDDSNIMVFNINAIERGFKLEGHSKRVTSLAFSTRLNILVSADENAQIFVWDAIKWKRLRDKLMPKRSEIMGKEISGTEIQFNRDLMHFLAVRSRILAMYKAKDLKVVNHWVVPDPGMLIKQATFSCDGMSVYAIFVNGSVGIFDAFKVVMRCMINPSALLSTYRCSPSVYPLSIIAHPLKNSQFAVGLTDGMVFVFDKKKSIITMPEPRPRTMNDSCIFKM
ncbi:WD40-repeat-containing domain [Sesbania bispinosa]|nr:WD40-repeat-containing domain [Sesbania bispinosa]